MIFNSKTGRSHNDNKAVVGTSSLSMFKLAWQRSRFEKCTSVLCPFLLFDKYHQTIVVISDGKHRHPSGGIEKREKHLGDLKHMVVDGNPKPDKMYLFEKLQQSQSKLQAEMRANKHHHSSDKDSRNDDNYSSDFPNSKQSSRSRRDSDVTRHYGRQTSRNGELIIMSVVCKTWFNIT